MFACGVPRTRNAYENTASGLLQDEYETCIDLDEKALLSYFKTSALLPPASGQIKFSIIQRNNIKAFVQWTKDKIRTGQDPAMLHFQLIGISKILKRASSHAIYVSNRNNAIVPKDFTKAIDWADCAPTFENYLRAMPGRTGVPLSYITREDDLPNPAPNLEFLDDYIMNAPLTGSDYLEDRRAVHIKLVALIASNPEAEALIKLNEKDANGRKSWKDLKLHYEGTGMHAIDVTAASNTLTTLIYKGENPPKETWDIFERKLNTAFATYVKHYKRETHCNEMKLTLLSNKIQCPKMAAISAAIQVAITAGGSYLYENAMASYKAEVSKHRTAEPSQRKVAAIDRRPWLRGGRGGRGGNGNGFRGRGSGRGRENGGRGRYSGRGNFQEVPKTVDNSIFFFLGDGTRIEYHPEVTFSDEIFAKFTSKQRDMLQYDRAHGTISPARENGYGNHTKRKIQQINQELQQQVWDLQSQSLPPPPPPASQVPAQVDNASRSQISQVTLQEGSVMGGRADQARMRQVQNTSTNANTQGGPYGGYGGQGGGRGGGRRWN